MQTHCNSQEPGERVLKDRLRSLREITAPDGLKQRLLDSIPSTSRRKGFRHGRHTRTWQVITAAAVVLFGALLFVKNTGLSPFSARLIAEVNETTQGHASTDQNSITDTNEANSVGQL